MSKYRIIYHKYADRYTVETHGFFGWYTLTLRYEDMMVDLFKQKETAIKTLNEYIEWKKKPSVEVVYEVKIEETT